MRFLALLALVGGTGSTPSPSVHGYVDAFYAWSSNRPFDHASFEPGTGTTAKRAGDVSLNALGLSVALDASSAGARASVSFGPSARVVHLGEPSSGGPVDPAVWEHVAAASVWWHPDPATTLEAGIFPSHIGFESFHSRENWNYTRSWMGEFSPYYQSGARVIRAAGPWSAQLDVLTGWQIDADNNDAKSLGSSIGFDDGTWHASLNTWAGPELPADDTHWRYFGDLIAGGRPLPSLEVCLSIDRGFQQRPPPSGNADWEAAGGYARLRIAESAWLAGRAEVFRDPDAGIGGYRQTLAEGTGTLEVRPAESLIVKLEGRYDRSTAPAFSSHRVDPAGVPIPVKSQTLALVSAVVSF